MRFVESRDARRSAELFAREIWENITPNAFGDPARRVCHVNGEDALYLK